MKLILYPCCGLFRALRWRERHTSDQEITFVLPLPLQQVVIAPLSTYQWSASPIRPVSDLERALIVGHYDAGHLQNDHQRDQSAN